MRAKQPRDKVWKGSISLPPAVHLYLQSRPEPRSVAITETIQATKRFKEWQEKQ